MYCQFHTHRGSKTAQGLCSLCFKDIPHCFCFTSSKLIERWRTPAPNAVRRIANTPTFSTTDASLTTFFRFPPEIRLQIYRLLLIADGEIKYHVCLLKTCFLVPPELRGKDKYRHSLFPSILETCRTIHREANPILYEKNEFKVNCCSVSSRVLELPCSSVLQITKIHMSSPETCSYQSSCSCYGGSSEARVIVGNGNEEIFQSLERLSDLKILKINLQCCFPDHWEDLVVQASYRLWKRRGVSLSITIPASAFANIRHPHHIWRGKVGKITPWNDLMSSFWSSAWRENPWENRKLRWRFGANVSTSFLVHYVPRDLRVVLPLSLALSRLHFSSTRVGDVRQYSYQYSV
jgi:hypothetical protein